MKFRYFLFALVLTAAVFASGCRGETRINVATFTPAVPSPTVLQAEPTPQLSPTAPPATATPISEPVGVTITRIKMVDGPSGWAVGEVAGNPNDLILRTSDGGTTWKQVIPDSAFESAPPGGVSATVYFQDNLYAWVVYAPRSLDPGEQPTATIWRSSDGGASWTTSSLPIQGLTLDYFLPAQIGFNGRQNGWILAHLGAGMGHDYVTLLLTRDSGASWEVAVSGTSDTLPMSGSKSGAAFLNSKNGWISGSYDGLQTGLYFWRTHDGGITWQRQIIPAPENISADLFINEENICGADAPQFSGDSSGTMVVTCSSYKLDQPLSWVYVTFDAGQTWNPRSLPGTSGTVDFLTPYQGWFLGLTDPAKSTSYQIFATQDSGLTWQQVAPVTWTGELQFLTAQVGWGVVELNDARALVKTTNGGYSWSVLKTTLLP